MTVKHIYFTLLTLVILTPDKSFSQNEINLYIDTDCICEDSTISTLEGTFGIYAYVVIPRYSGKYQDTLIKTLEFKPYQTINLEQGNYKLKFTPFDSTKKMSQYYFNYAPPNNYYHLNCSFFKKKKTPLFSQMKKRDTLYISSTYCGNTHEMMPIPTHTLVIIKNHDKYYASYYKQIRYEMQIVILPKNGYGGQIPKTDQQILLNEKQLQLIRQFEDNLVNIAIDDNLGYEAMAHSSIGLSGRKFISFYTKNYVSLNLWNEIRKYCLDK